MAEKSFYLKPSKTIEFNHTPTDSEIEAYLLISENSSTEGIYHPLSSSDEGPYDTITSIFEFSGILPEDYCSINSINLIINNEGETANFYTIDGVYEYSLQLEEQIYTNSVSYTGLVKEAYIHNPYQFKGITEKDNTKINNAMSSFALIDMDEIFFYAGLKMENEKFSNNIINFNQAKSYLENYIKEKHKLPPIKIHWSSKCNSLYLSEEDTISQSNLKTASNITEAMKITNMLIKITYNTNNSKIQLSDELTPLKNAYIKTNGQWELLNKDELRNIVANYNYYYSAAEEKYPMLLPEQGWKKEWTSNISQIDIEDNHIPDETCKNFWFADISENGSITCYRYDNKIVISGNGTGGIYLHPNSKNLFKNDVNYKQIKIKGIDLLHTYDWTNVEGMFYNCDIGYGDFSNWKIYNLKNFFSFGIGIQYNVDGEDGIILPNYIDYIPENAFLGSNLFPLGTEQINIIGKNAFRNSDLYWPAMKASTSKTTAIMDGAFQGCETGFGSYFLPETVKFIGAGAYAFMHSSQLNDEGDAHDYLPISLPPEIEYIGDQAFYCANLNGELIFPESLKYLGVQAFQGNDITGEVIFPSGIKKINMGVLKNTNVNKVVILEGITEIDSFAFSSCPLLEEIQISKDVNKISYRMMKYSYNATINIDSNNKKYKMINGLLIENNNKIVICDNNFTNDSIIPNSIIKIGDEAFRNANNFTSITIPSSVQYIGRSAFYRNEDENQCFLKTVTMKGKVPPTIFINNDGTADIFETYRVYDDDTVERITIKVPQESIDLYKTKWANLADYIIGY